MYNIIIFQAQNQEEILQILQFAVCVRPFCQEKFLKISSRALEFLLKNDTDNNLEEIYLTVRILSQAMCPKEFLSITDKYPLISKLSQFVSDKFVPKTLSILLKIAGNDTEGNWIQRKFLGPLAGQILVQDLSSHLGHHSNEVRFWILTCLTQIWPEDQIYGAMLSAESTEPGLNTYRDRAKYLTQLSFEFLQKSSQEGHAGVFR